MNINFSVLKLQVNNFLSSKYKTHHHHHHHQTEAVKEGEEQCNKNCTVNSTTSLFCVTLAKGHHKSTPCLVLLNTAAVILSLVLLQYKAFPVCVCVCASSL